MDKMILALEFALIGCILVILGFLMLFTTPQKKSKEMTIYDCLETMGDYSLCERKIINGR